MIVKADNDSIDKIDEQYKVFVDDYNTLLEDIEDFKYDFDKVYQEIREWIKIGVEGKRFEVDCIDDEVEYQKDRISFDKLRASIDELEDSSDAFFEMYNKAMRYCNEYNDEHNIIRNIATRLVKK